MRIAIVTGASSGLGREFVLQLAHGEAQLDEIWVIARRRARLEALQKDCPLPLRILPIDLTAPDAPDRLARALARRAPRVEVLVNAAGFGRIGSYQDISRQDSAAMIRLNCEAAVEVTGLCLPYMGPGSRIVQVCSTAAFQPLPYLNVYAGTKAFLYRYGRALSVELAPRRVGVTVVCPYWIRDTEFIAVARQGEDQPYFRRFPFASSTAFVAKTAWDDIQRGKAVSTPGWAARLIRIGAKVLPSALVMKMSRILFG